MGASPDDCTLNCHDAFGRVVARVRLRGNATRSGSLASILTDESTGVSALRERETYDYRIESESGEKFVLMQDPGVRQDGWESSRGKIKLGDYCGELVLRLAEAGETSGEPVATARVTVRSVKLNYESHYRAMLTDIGRICAGLLIESGSPTRLRFEGEWSRTPQSIEQQLEFLRHLLDTPEFDGAFNEVMRHPHRRLESVREIRDISSPFRAGKDFARQVATASRRVRLPESHPLCTYGLESLPAKVSVTTRHDDFDTAENRFIKLVLTEYRDFLSEILGFLKSGECKLMERAARDHVEQEAERLLTAMEARLARGFLPDVDMPELLPLGSPVLQRKAGYREMLRGWLQFHAGASFLWDDSPDVFHAGARNVAKLYEYWLFFQLHALFQKKFVCDRPLHESLIERKDGEGFSTMSLRRGKSLKASGYRQDPADERKLRSLRAELHFNRKFSREQPRPSSGSWTLGVQPDYTLSLWPSHFGTKDGKPKVLEPEDAERLELMVHIHFDAKYRIENIAEILGAKDDADIELGDDDAETEANDRVKTMSGRRPSAKYQDLLKMHAYRDAIRRTAGAYVLYPGDATAEERRYDEFPGFHEILPGLGAFPICPDSSGDETGGLREATGLRSLEAFIDKLIEHLSDRTTARERTTYHVAESYPDVVEESPTTYKAATLPETDFLADGFRAPPPADEMVLVAWYNNDAQCELAMSATGFYYARLGAREGALRIHPNLSRVRRILLHSKGEHGGEALPGFLLLREQGFEIHTRRQLREKLLKEPNGSKVSKWVLEPETKESEEYIYACFQTKSDSTFVHQRWDGAKLAECIKRFERDRRNLLKEAESEAFDPKKDFPIPRILSLKDVLDARA